MADTGRGLTDEGIVRRYQQRIYGIIYRMIGGTAEADDLCQETLLQILRNRPALDQARDRDAWICRIAMNVSVDHIRRKTRDRVLAEKSGALAPVRGPAGLGGPEAAARMALDRLAPELRQVLILRIFEELSHEQISEALAVPVGTVRWRFFEARRRMAETLRPYLTKEGFP